MFNKKGWHKISQDTLLKMVVLTSLFLGLIFIALGSKEDVPVGISLMIISMYCITSRNLSVENYKGDKSFFRYKAENYENGLNGWKLMLIIVLFLTFILVTYFYGGLIKEFNKNYLSIFLMIPSTVFIALVYFFLKRRIYVSEILHEEYSYKYSVELEYKNKLEELKNSSLDNYPKEDLHKLWLKTLELNPTKFIKKSNRNNGFSFDALDKISRVFKNMK